MINYTFAKDRSVINPIRDKEVAEILNRAYTSIGSKPFKASHVVEWFQAEGKDAPSSKAIAGSLKRLGIPVEYKYMNALYYRLIVVDTSGVD